MPPLKFAATSVITLSNLMSLDSLIGLLKSIRQIAEKVLSSSPVQYKFPQVPFTPTGAPTSHIVARRAGLDVTIPTEEEELAEPL